MCDVLMKTNSHSDKGKGGIDTDDNLVTTRENIQHQNIILCRSYQCGTHQTIEITQINEINGDDKDQRWGCWGWAGVTKALVGM